MSFENLQLSEPVLRSVTTKGYSQPTPIQAQAIPLILQGRDLIGSAPHRSFGKSLVGEYWELDLKRR
jgi:superfamily II DNA/RNA helicase